MTEKPKLHSNIYELGLTYDEIHLLLKAMDTHLEEYPALRKIKAVETIYSKLEPLHARHSMETREKLWEKLSSESKT